MKLKLAYLIYLTWHYELKVHLFSVTQVSLYGKIELHFLHLLITHDWPYHTGLDRLSVLRVLLLVAL